MLLRFTVLAKTLSILLLWNIFAVTAMAEPSLSARELEGAIAEHLMDVEEFRIMRQEAEKLGIRLYLFGGTAAGFGHYVKWDLQRKKGDPRFQKERFDYDFTNIYRSTQDADLVVDGSEEQLEKLKTALRQQMPYVSGSKEAEWDIRLLTKSTHNRMALRDDPNFLNQHSDSNSTGLIEVTKPQISPKILKPEPIIKDLRDWDADFDKKPPHFFEDIRQSRLTYYFSPTHGQTEMAKSGANPPILSAVRYLTKAFQYELDVKDSDMEKVKKVISEFDPGQLTNPDAKRRLEKIGKRLFMHAVNLEYAWDKLEELGLTKKLISFSGKPDEKGTLAWWMNKEPLRTNSIGQRKEGANDSKALPKDHPLSGKTIQEFISEGFLPKDFVVAHETSDFLAFESITRSHKGEPNVFISRDGSSHETAAYGNGFYTAIGRKGARGTGLTARFTVNPLAREGVDFTIHSTEKDRGSFGEGDYVVWKNRAALQVIPESINIDPVGYMKMLSNGEITREDRGLVEKLRRRIGFKIARDDDKVFFEAAKLAEKSELAATEFLKLHGDQNIAASRLESLAKLVKHHLDHSDSPQMTELIRAWTKTKGAEKYPDLVSDILRAKLQDEIHPKSINMGGRWGFDIGKTIIPDFLEAHPEMMTHPKAAEWIIDLCTLYGGSVYGMKTLIPLQENGSLFNAAKKALENPNAEFKRLRPRLYRDDLGLVTLQQLMISTSQAAEHPEILKAWLSKSNKAKWENNHTGEVRYYPNYQIRALLFEKAHRKVLDLPEMDTYIKDLIAEGDTWGRNIFVMAANNQPDDSFVLHPKTAKWLLENVPEKMKHSYLRGFLHTPAWTKHPEAWKVLEAFLPAAEKVEIEGRWNGPHQHLLVEREKENPWLDVPRYQTLLAEKARKDRSFAYLVEVLMIDNKISSQSKNAPLLLDTVLNQRSQKWGSGIIQGLKNHGWFEHPDVLDMLLKNSDKPNHKALIEELKQTEFFQKKPLPKPGNLAPCIQIFHNLILDPNY